jgi:DNA repair exonuclease SbcCD nuclease subunit
MSRFCFVHAADLHLDTPFEGVGRVPPAIASELRDASLAAWDALVSLAIERGAAFLLLAGDIYDGDERGIRAQARFRAGLQRLAERGVQVFLVHGNHDPLEGWSAIPQWPEGTVLFGAHVIESVPVVRDGQRLATVHGVSFPRRDCVENLAAGFRRDRGEDLQIGLLHANVGGNPAHAPYAPCTVDDLRRTGMDYWALGHVHERGYLSAGGPWIVYPGNLQARSRAIGESEPKGAVVVAAEDGAVRNVEFVALDRVRFATLRVEVPDGTDAADEETVLGLVLDRLADMEPVQGGRGLLIDLQLHGARGAARASALLARLRAETARRQPFVWWTGLQRAALAGLDRDDLRRRGDLAAAVLQRGEVLRAEAGERERFLDACFEPLLRKWVAELEPGEAPALLREAEELAIESLRGEGEP